MKEKIALAADHKGFGWKAKLAAHLEKNGFEVQDSGCFSEESCDYPDFILDAAEKVAGGRCQKAIGICYTGIGSAIVANKVPGIRAALVHNLDEAGLSRAHNDSNMLILGSAFMDDSLLIPIVEKWLTTPFEGGRHERRVNKIREYEQNHGK